MATPKIKDAINFAKHQPEYNELQRRREQFLTYEMPLPPSNRDTFPQPRKHEPDTAFLQPFHRLGAFSILKYVFPRYTIRPDGTYLKRYEWFRAACALLSSNIFPLSALLILQWPWLWYLAVFLDFSAYFDIIQRMLVGYFDKNGILVYHPSATAVHYLKGAFLLDMFACLPLEVLDSIRNTIYFENNAFRHPSTCQILMYNRIAQLYRFPNALEFLNEYIDRQDAILLIKAIPLFMSLLVLVTSLIVELSLTKWLPIDGGWRLQIVRDDSRGSWIDFSADAVRYNITLAPWNAALTAFYWVVYETTTTGFNVFQPSRIGIMEVLIGAMILGAITTTYFAVRIISIRSNVNQELASFQENMKDMVSYMTREKLDQQLQREVVSYYEYSWEKMGGTDYRTVLKLCDQITLRTDAIMHIYGRTFSKCPILKKAELALLRIMGRSVNSMYFRKQMTIVELNDIVTEIYFVNYGIIEVREHNYDFEYDDEVITRLTNGSLFGNLDNTKTVLSKNIFVAGSNVSLLKINSEAFHKIIQDFPTVKALMRKFRPYNEDYIASSIEPTMSIYHVSKKDSASKPPNKTPRIFKYFHSNSKFGQTYLILVSILCVYLDIYNAGFQNNTMVLIIILYILDVAFLMKILVNYYFPYITEEEALSRISSEILRKRYMKTEFKCDVLACIPFEIFCLLKKDLWRAFAIYRLKSCLRMMTVHYCLKRYQEKLSINLTVTTITSVFIWFTLFVHTSTCIWYYLGVMYDDYEPRSSWRYGNDGKTLCDNQYICAVYYILTTFTQNGVGDILPRKKTEIIFTCILMILSTLIYMIYVGEFSNIIQYQLFRYFSFYTKYLELQEFLKNNRVSSNLVKITNAYVKHLWRESRGLQAPHFLEHAPQCLRLNIMSAAYMSHLKSHPVFQECEPAFLRHLVGCLQPYTYNEDMFVVKEGQITDSMYFIHRGKVQQVDEDLDGEIFSVYRAGDHFGTENGLNRDTAYDFSYKTVLKSQVLTLPLQEWEHLLKHFPRTKDIIYKNMDPDEDGLYDKKIFKNTSVPETNFSGPQLNISPKQSYAAHFSSEVTSNTKENLEPKMTTENRADYNKEYQIKTTLFTQRPTEIPLRSREQSNITTEGSDIPADELTATVKKTTEKEEEKSALASNSNEQSVNKPKTNSLLAMLRHSVITFKGEVDSKITLKREQSNLSPDNTDILDEEKPSFSPKAGLKSYAVPSESISTHPSSSSTVLASSEYSDPVQQEASETDLAYESSLSMRNRTKKSIENLFDKKSLPKILKSKTEQRQSDVTLAHRHRRAQLLQDLQSQSSSNSLIGPSTSRMLERPPMLKKKRRKRSHSESELESYSPSPYVTANEDPDVPISSESVKSLNRVHRPSK